jgi:hypothetical protein
MCSCEDAMNSAGPVVLDCEVPCDAKLPATETLEFNLW